MPTYEYECRKCGKTFEVFQSMNDRPIKTCPDRSCRGKVRRLIGTGGGFIFKGAGFYATDYKKSGHGDNGRSEKRPDSSCQSCDKKEGGCDLAK